MLKEWVSPFVFVVLLTQVGVAATRVDGVSMMPGLRNNEEVIIPKLEGWAHRFGLGTYHRGDIVVFKPPRAAASEWKHDIHGVPLPWAYRPYLIKRVIGVAGDRIRIEEGQVTINGHLLDAHWTQDFWRAQGCLDTTSAEANAAVTGLFPNAPATRTLTVPAGSLFVMGDNRSPGGSLDSRYFGTVPLADVAGRAVLSVWPILRNSQAAALCASADPKNSVTTSGPSELNLRVLNAPATFADLDK
ncbi:signal peptidase I [Deinococcus sp. KNUC1210]|uniref:signal peptidase I n=1 Tax=Deinococcus sp. KNUC1210 TaxID=2917691 RepID=UPI001EF0DEA6|nr:signal peptidase I [Deinococcus sp. KNUC1210]ULH16578.1 signal peptidase I [Deinococcus sp. KNUC1210]